MFAFEQGVSIIEASAGTGKTYTLCRIALKLTLEKDIPIDRILCVTFTQAATEELSTRIRELYRDCLDQLESGKIEEAVLKDILATETIDIPQAQKRLRYSLEIFDEAPISTIHGFCKRSLDLVSLETDTAFDANLEQIEDDLIERLKNEYIRIHILERSVFLSAVSAAKPTVQKKLQLIGRECSSHPYALLEPAGSEFSLGALDETFQAALQATQVFLDKADTITPHLKKRSKLDSLLKLENKNALEALLKRGHPLISDLTLLESLTSEAWKKGVKKSAEGINQPKVFELVDAFWRQTALSFDAIAARYRDWLFKHLRAEKERRNIISFNDLLHLLDRALDEDRGQEIACSIGDRYDAALVDEFQDTDPIQYRIVQRLFGDNSKYLFLIGDPKQAIYRFRGADIFAYFKATVSGNFRRIELSNNYRSSPTLVDGVNTLFENAPDGFAFDQIQFSPVSAARESSNDSPLKIEVLKSDDPKPLNQGELTRKLALSAAQDLAERLRDNPQFDLSSVAFLVNRNSEADVLFNELSRHGFDSIIKSERSVFQTDEAITMALLLETLSNPSNLRKVRALMLTPLVGYSWEDLLQDDFEDSSYSIISHLHDWSKSWHSTNFDTAFNELLSQTSASNRMLGMAEGERQYANFCQLSELLQEEARSRQSSPIHLLSWLEGKTNENVSTREDWQTRLRSDFGKPQIVTIHKSKGLEYPIVICPFMSLLRPKPKREYALYHASDRDDQLVIDLSPESNQTALDAATREEYAEHLRLIYVALTRAADECIVYLGPEEQSSRSKAPPSSFCQLVLGSETAIQLQLSKTASSALLKRIQDLASPSIEIATRSIDSIASQNQYVHQAPQRYHESVSPRAANEIEIPYPERILSFSSISHLGRSLDSPLEEIVNDEPILIDDLPIQITAPEPYRPTIFNLPKGAHTGNLFHSILETIDFQKPQSLTVQIAESFERLRYGNLEYKPVVRAQLDRLLDKQLQNDGSPFSLKEIPAKKRFAELEFAYPTSHSMLKKLADAFETHAPPRIKDGWLKNSPLGKANVHSSMMRGFIDLVLEHDQQLYIIDWKTNHLGDQPENYSQPSLDEAMSKHDYYLQYCLYCVALKRHFETRSGNTSFFDHFGGVFYLFIRGIDDSSDNGVFYDRPSEALLNALDTAIGS